MFSTLQHLLSQYSQPPRSRVTFSRSQFACPVQMFNYTLQPPQ